MPWHVTKSAKCPASKPWAVVKDSDGTVEGCHASEAAAKKQMAALYANEPGRGSMTAAVERRFTAVPVEIRASDGKRRIGGYAAVFNRYSQNLGGFVEQVDPAAFNKSRGDGWPDVLARYNHDDNRLLGTTDGGTLRLSVDGTGLIYEVEPPSSRSDVLELVERGDVRKSSFAFRVFPDGDDWSLTDQGFPLRTLLSVQLVDVAPVNLPAYTDTSVGARALESLAAKMQASLEEVRQLAEANDLRRFFVKTGKAPAPQPATPKVFGPAAATALLGRKEDPWADQA